MKQALPQTLIETKRLLLIPLTYGQLLNYLKADGSLEKELGLQARPREISQELMEAFQFAILPAVAIGAEQSFYYTLWTIIWKEEKAMVGDCCFKGPPNESGEIEIGYGTHPAFQKQGFMTEAIGAFARWAWAQPDVKAIIAETDKDNFASQKILEKNRFSSYRVQDEMVWWRLHKPCSGEEG